jgi:DNA-binding IclR family transcriptional regulator
VRSEKRPDVLDDDLTDDHLRLLEWLDGHPTGSLTAAAQALGLEVAEVEALCDELVAAGMIERVREQEEVVAG